MKLRRLVFLFAAFTVLSSCLSAGDVVQAKSPQSEYRDAVVKDWSEQEREQGREIASFEALEALVERAQNACDWLESESWIDDDALDEVRKELDDARAFLEKGEDAVDGDEPALLGAFSHYLKLRGKLRAILMSNPDVSGQPLVFLKEERFVWQMLHEFLSYYYDQCGMRGGGVYVLKEPGKSFETESLTDGLFPRGVFQTLSLSYDAKTVYFSFADWDYDGVVDGYMPGKLWILKLSDPGAPELAIDQEYYATEGNWQYGNNADVRVVAEDGTLMVYLMDAATSSYRKFELSL